MFRLKQRHRLIISSLALVLLACQVWQPLAVVSTVTPTPVVIHAIIKGQPIQVDEPSPTPIVATSTPIPTSTAIVFASPFPPPPTTEPVVILIASATPSQQPMATVITSLPSPISSPTPIPLANANPPSNTNAAGWPVTDDIILIDPQPGFRLPAELDQLEFKWNWVGEEIRICELREGHGFEVRIWPAPDNPKLPPGEINLPLGTINAVEEQDIITASCDPKTGMRRLTVNYLKNTPGVQKGGGWGHFYWDVAHIQLESFYRPIAASAPRDFFIPPPSNATPTATPTATPLFVTEPGPRPIGNITLKYPESGAIFPPTVGPVEMKWNWNGALFEDSCQPAVDYGFEIRVSSTQPGFVPLGVMNAVTEQDKISCDPSTGDFNYTIPALRELPGVKQTYMGEFRWNGQFQWDVALVSLNPYTPPTSSATPNTFEITLEGYTGPFDPTGVPLKCGVFSDWIEAQALFLAAGGPGKDFHKLDPDGNQIACDELRE